MRIRRRTGAVVLACCVVTALSVPAAGAEDGTGAAEGEHEVGTRLGSAAAVELASAATRVAASGVRAGARNVGAGGAAVGTGRSPRTTPCVTVIPGLGTSITRRIPAVSTQVVLAAGSQPSGSWTTVSFYSRAGGCWTKVRSVPARNGYAGWSRTPSDGSGLSPIGVFGLSDAGGRKRNPGTSLPYHYGPQAYASGGYRMNSDPVQMFDYVVAVNFNRYVGRAPRDDGRPNPKIPDGGIWWHVSGAGATRGCISVSEADMIWALRWLKPTAAPVMVMGPVQQLRLP